MPMPMSFNPRAPLLEAIAELRATQDPLALLQARTPPLATLALLLPDYRDRQLTPGRESDHVSGDHLLEAFLDYMERLSTEPPGDEDLRDAPLLENWCAGLMDPFPRLFGQVTGHPRLRLNARIFTSPYCQLRPEKGWARTWSRFYRLGQYDRGVLDGLKRDGVIASHSRIIEPWL
ncbi:DUF6634 family protein [Rhodovulum adriaticum]|uniref:Uncharacterized protein n=1 Tax=Rhodovulum adriaticum TaxID=35804 RepID=A0A4R2NG99_RHOAD|nr:DUF6634 family protein [Rhodovulum adriaticum]MBK1637247.1 hypothetical protein [Rhodovulum adriaticum]TCP20222.1 hypothetical protein EV656_1222 [Rhodovulum adriaticum]